jgi:hypothetical protein
MSVRITVSAPSLERGTSDRLAAADHARIEADVADRRHHAWKEDTVTPELPDASRDFRLPTQAGVLVVTVGDPAALVQVLNAEGQVRITRPGQTRPLTVSVVPGKHQLKLHNDGFVLLAETIEIEPGGQRAITAKLIPLGDQPDLAGAPATP